MTDQRSKFWFDIVQAADAVAAFTAGIDLLNAYAANGLVKSAY